MKKTEASLLLKIDLVFGIVFLSLFLGIMGNIVFKDFLLNIDHQILNFVPSIRTPTGISFFSFITFFGSWQSATTISIVVSLLLARKKQIFVMLMFLGTLITSEVLTFLLKQFFGRARPDQTLSLVTENSFSFPSGHTIAATAIFGFLGYLLIKSIKNFYVKILIFLLSISGIILVALSRVYLGVHYPSDVLASIMLGAFILMIFIAILEKHPKGASSQNVSGLF